MRLAYIDEGQGETILLIHGFCTNLEHNWIKNGWVDNLVAAGYRTVGLDNRGHGHSKKLFDPELYTLDVMADDVIRLLDYLEIDRVHVIGYSLGARIAAVLTLRHPDRVRSLVFGGLGDLNADRGMAGMGSVQRALQAPSLDFAVDFVARSVRVFAESTGSNLKAMAACLKKGASEIITIKMFGEINVPVLVALGDGDAVAGSAVRLAALIPKGEALVIEGLGHLNTMQHDEFVEASKAFIAKHS